MALEGDTAVIDASRVIDGSINPELYVFIRSGLTWNQQQELIPVDGTGKNQQSRRIIDLSGNTVVSGSWHQNPSGEKVNVFVRSGTTWTEQQELVPDDGSAYNSAMYYNMFGHSVAIDGDTVLIGARNRDDNGRQSGAAYVFVRSNTTWTQQQKLVPSDGKEQDFFGETVALDGDTAVIGALRADSLYIFVRSGTTWTQQQKLVANDGLAGDEFSNSVAIDGDTLVSGAWQSVGVNSTTRYVGSVYIFQFSENPCDASTAPTDGSVGNCTSSLAHGATCQPTCNSGYTVSGTSSCNAGTLTAATCSGNSCDASTAPTNGGVGTCTSSLAHGATCQPTCNNGYTVSGTSSCSTGTLTAATCSVSSPSPPPPAPPPAKASFTASYTLNGYTKSSFDLSAQDKFKNTVADILGISPGAVQILSVYNAFKKKRRTLLASSDKIDVDFKVEALDDSDASRLSTAITSIPESQLVTKLQYFGLSEVTEVSIPSSVVFYAPPPSPPSLSPGIMISGLFGLTSSIIAALVLA